MNGKNINQKQNEIIKWNLGQAELHSFKKVFLTQNRQNCVFLLEVDPLSVLLLHVLNKNKNIRIVPPLY